MPVSLHTMNPILESDVTRFFSSPQKDKTPIVTNLISIIVGRIFGNVYAIKALDSKNKLTTVYIDSRKLQEWKGAFIGDSSNKLSDKGLVKEFIRYISFATLETILVEKTTKHLPPNPQTEERLHSFFTEPASFTQREMELYRCMVLQASGPNNSFGSFSAMMGSNDTIIIPFHTNTKPKPIEQVTWKELLQATTLPEPSHGEHSCIHMIRVMKSLLEKQQYRQP